MDEKKPAPEEGAFESAEVTPDEKEALKNFKPQEDEAAATGKVSLAAAAAAAEEAAKDAEIAKEAEAGEPAKEAPAPKGEDGEADGALPAGEPTEPATEATAKVKTGVAALAATAEGGAAGTSFEGETPAAAAGKLSPGLKKILIATGVVMALLLIGATAYGLVFFNQVKEPQKVLLGDLEQSGKEEPDLAEVFSEHIVNIGLLGFDRGWNREEYGEYLFRPDMLAVLSINFLDNDIAVVRVPRDSYVPIHNMGGFHDKINHSYYYGYRSGATEDAHADGIKNALATVSDVLGVVPIHYYISVDMYSIVELVDAVGGIYYESEQEIIDKHWEKGRVLVPKGPQLMDGKTYLRYLQYRDDATGQDYGRIDRQMNLLKETYLYLRQQGKITDLPTIYRIYKDYVETDLTYKQIAALAYYAAEFKIDEESLKFFTITGDGQMKDGIWYQVLFQNRRVEIIKEVFGIDAEKWAPIVLVDSPEYLEEQERKRLEEEFGPGFEGFDGFVRPRLNQDEEGKEGEEGAGRAPSSVTQGVTVPDLYGKTLTEARLLLEQNSLKPGELRERDSTQLEPGLVIFTDPMPGTRVNPGTVVVIVVARTPKEGAW